MRGCVHPAPHKQAEHVVARAEKTLAGWKLIIRGVSGMKTTASHKLIPDSQNNRHLNAKRPCFLFVIGLISALLGLACFILLTEPLATAHPTPSSPAIQLTPDEQAWLKAHPVIRLAPHPDFKPIEYFDFQDTYQGLAADNLRLLEHKLGIQFSIIKAGNWDEALRRFQHNEIDMLGAVAATPKSLELMRISAPLFNVPGAIIVRNTVDRNLTFDKLTGLKVAVVSNYEAHDIMSNKYPYIQLDLVSSTSAGLTKVSFNMADAYVENLATATYYIQEAVISNLHVAGETPFSYNWGVGIRKDWPELEGIINKGIAAITFDERRAILNRWIPVSQQWRPGKSFIISSLALSVSLLLGVILFWNRSLNQRVTRRTDALNKEIDERKRAEQEVRTLNAELENRVKARTHELEREVAERQMAQEALVIKQGELENINESLGVLVSDALSELRQRDQMLIQQGRLAAMGEMLNNIAHHWRQPLNNIGLLVQSIRINSNRGRLTTEDMNIEATKAMAIIMEMSNTIDNFRNFFRVDSEKQNLLIGQQVMRTLDFLNAVLKESNIKVNLDIDENVRAIGYQNEYGQVLLNILANAKDILMERKISDPCICIQVRNEGSRSLVTIRDNGGGIAEDVMPKIFDPYFTTKEPDKGTGIGLYMSKVIMEQNMNGRLSAKNVEDGVEFRIEL